MQQAVNNAILRGEEKKNIDVNSSGAIQFATTTASVLLFNLTSQGAGATQRLGRRFTMTSLEYRWAGSMTATGTGASPLRLTILYDRQTNGATPTAVQAFTFDAIHSPMNLINNRRFKVIVDEIIDNIGTQGPQSFYVKGHRDLTNGGRKKGLECECANTNNGDVTDIMTGGMFGFVWQNGNILVAAPTSELFVRVRFTDS